MNKVEEILAEWQDVCDNATPELLIAHARTAVPRLIEAVEMLLDLTDLAGITREYASEQVAKILQPERKSDETTDSH